MLIRKQALGYTRSEERRDRRSALSLPLDIWGSGVACSQSWPGESPIIHMTLKMADSTCEQHPGGGTHHCLHFLLLAKVFVIMG